MLNRWLVIVCFAAIAAVHLVWDPSRQAGPAEVVCWVAGGALEGHRDRPSEGEEAPLGDLGAALAPVASEDLPRAPYSSVGRLVFDEGGRHFVATAAFIAPNLLITAAHNVIDDANGPVSRMAFFRASTAERPYQNRFDVEAGVYLSSWRDDVAGAPDRYDLAVLRTRQSYDGGHLSLADRDPPMGGTFDIVAYSDVADDDSRGQMFHKRMKLDGLEDGTFSSEPADARPGRAFTHGASGGVWLADGSGVFSVEVSGRGLAENGPALGADLGRMIDAAAGCGR